jgi:hypothetical protein
LLIPAIWSEWAFVQGVALVLPIGKFGEAFHAGGPMGEKGLMIAELVCAGNA